MNRDELVGHWNEVKGRLQEHWGQLTDDDLQRAKGSAQQLVGVVQQKTGATRNEVESFLRQFIGDSELTDQVSRVAKEYGDAAQQVAGEAAAYLRDGYDRASRSGVEYSERVVDSIRTRPKESLAIAFGIGIAAGALLFFRKR